MDSAETQVHVDRLSVAFGEKVVLDEISFDVHSGEIVVFMGRSGCGKTSLLKSLIGLIRPERGKINVLGHDLIAMDEDAIDEFRERIGMLFQFGALINSLTVGENILLPLHRRCRIDDDTARSVAQLKLAMVGLPDVFDLYPSQLSGGMRKRAGFARALILDPEILFFDEPTSGLDPNTSADMDLLILNLREVLQTTMVIVTHDLESAFAVADRIIMLHEGRIVAAGSPDELRRNDDPAVQDFVERRGTGNWIEADRTRAGFFK